MNNGFARTGNGGNFAEGHFTVATVKGTHQAFTALGVTGDNRHFCAQINITEGLGNMIIQAQLFVRAPVGEVNKACVDILAAQQLHGIKRTVRFPQSTEHFAYAVQVIIQLEVTKAANHFKMFQALMHILNAFLNKLIRALIHHGVIGKQVGIDGQHTVQHFLQFVLPWTVFVHFGKQGIHTGLAAFFVFQQAVGHTGISRNHEYPLI